MATKKKALKKSKLRHAEYYDFQKIQDKLYAESMDGKMFTKLVEIITLPENIKLAYRNIKKNKGSKTAGTDGKTIQHLEKLSEEKLVVLVQRKFSWYVPQSVRRVEIPKDNGKTRPLGIPTIMDRLVQQCVLQVLEPICEAKFHDHSYGFRPNRSQQHAISQVHKNMQLSHLHYVVDIDIKGFFDNVSHGKLLKQLWTLGICDKKLISIISAMLKAEVAGIGFPEKGTPQGGIISPLLSNIVLNELDWWLASQWENIPTQYPFKQTPNRNGSPNHGNKYVDQLMTEQEYMTLKRRYKAEAEEAERLIEALTRRQAAEAAHTPENPFLAAFGSFRGADVLTKEMAQALIERVYVDGDSNIEIVFRYRDEYKELCTYLEGRETDA